MLTEERLIILLSTQTISDKSKTEISEIINSKKVNWPLFIKIASLHKIENFIYSNLRTNGLTGILPEKVEKQFKSIYYQVSIRNTQFKSLVENISSSCYNNKILLVKGSSLILDFYQDLGARRLGDVDILVHKSDRDAIWTSLLNNGWSSDNWPGFKSNAHSIVNDALYKTMHYLYYGKLDNNLFIDIHWKFYIGDGADDASIYALENCKKLSNNLFVHKTEMQLIHLCCNNMLDYKQGGVMYMRNLCDVNEILLTRKINWNKVEQILNIGGSSSFMRKAVEHTLSIINKLYGTSIPVQHKKDIFNGLEITPSTILRLPVTIERKGAWASFKEKLQTLDNPSLLVQYLFREIVPDHKWLTGMYPSKKCPLIAYWSYMFKRHILHKKISYQS